MDLGNSSPVHNNHPRQTAEMRRKLIMVVFNCTDASNSHDSHRRRVSEAFVKQKFSLGAN